MCCNLLLLMGLTADLKSSRRMAVRVRIPAPAPARNPFAIRRPDGQARGLNTKALPTNDPE
jgi:hypothetical protein